jgi:ketosteroid isomerase-like protein
MSDANKQLVQDFLTAFYSGDIDGALKTCDDDVEFIVNAPVEFFPHFGLRHGKTEVAETWRALHARYASMRYEVPFLIADDSRAAAIIKIYFRKSSTERVVQTSIADFYTFRGGRIASIQQFFDTFDAIEQTLERDITAMLKQRT